jgi:uncharacterized membrane protein
MSETSDEPTRLASPEVSRASGPEITQITAEVTRQVITRVSRFFSGPLPPPDVLVGYNEAFDGAAERIVAMAESQLKHRQNMESRVVASNCSNEWTGQVIGAVLSGIAILGGIYLAAKDKPLSGFGVIILDLATLAGVFVYSRKAQTKERQDKLKPFKPVIGDVPPTPPASPAPSPR